MRFIQTILLLALAPIGGFVQITQQGQSVSIPRQPAALVRSLYTQVVSRHPVGVAKGADMKTFAPYLSEALLRRVNLTSACEADWYRQHPENGMKPDFGWLELGLFSGDEEMAAPSAFHIEKTETEKDGSVRVYVKLTHGESEERPWTWRVAAVLIKEDDHYAVDDIIYLKDRNNTVDVRLSDRLSRGCDGPRWVGESSGRNNPKP